MSKMKPIFNRGQVKERMMTERAELHKDKLNSLNPAVREIDAAIDALVSTKKESIQNRLDVIAEYGSVKAYQAALKENTFVVSSDDPKSWELMRKMYNNLLVPLIPIPDERAPLEDLMSIQGMHKTGNETGDAIRAQIGRWQEVWVITLDPKTKEPIAAGNTSMYSAKGKETEEYLNGTAVNIYLLVDPKYRKLGLANHVMEARKEVVRDFLGEDYPDVPKDKLRFAMFNEQNDPSKMSLHDYFFDTAGSGIDQCVRQMVFGKAYGNKTLAFPYAQPALEEGSAPVDSLFYNAFLQGVPKDDPLQKKGLPSCVVRENLQCFFGQSVFLGEDYSQDPTWIKQRDFLASKPTIEWTPPFDFKRYMKDVWDYGIKVANGSATDGNNLRSKKLFNRDLIGDTLKSEDYIKGSLPKNHVPMRPKKKIKHLEQKND